MVQGLVQYQQSLAEHHQNDLKWLQAVVTTTSENEWQQDIPRPTSKGQESIKTIKAMSSTSLPTKSSWRPGTAPASGAFLAHPLPHIHRAATSIDSSSIRQRNGPTETSSLLGTNEKSITHGETKQDHRRKHSSRDTTPRRSSVASTSSKRSRPRSSAQKQAQFFQSLDSTVQNIMSSEDASPITSTRSSMSSSRVGRKAPLLERTSSMPATHITTISVPSAYTSAINSYFPPQPTEDFNSVDTENVPVKSLPAATIDWTSPATRRDEYREIDRDHSGFRGLWKKIMPRCLHQSSRRGFYTGSCDGDSVRRFRIDLPDIEDSNARNTHDVELEKPSLPFTPDLFQTKKGGRGPKWNCFGIVKG